MCNYEYASELAIVQRQHPKHGTFAPSHADLGYTKAPVVVYERLYALSLMLARYEGDNEGCGIAVHFSFLL